MEDRMRMNDENEPWAWAEDISYTEIRMLIDEVRRMSNLLYAEHRE